MRFTVIALAVLSLAAQAAEKSPRTCRILFLNGNEGPEKLFLFDGTSSREVELTRMSFSPAYKIAGGDITLTLLPKAPGAPPVIEPDAPKAAVPAAVTDCYLLVSSDPANKVAPVRIQMVNASPDSFPPGHMLWFNLTGNRIVGMLGTHKLDLAPNSRVIADPPVARHEDYHVNIRYLPPGASRAEPLCETNWSHDPRSRTVNFIIGQGGAAPRILGFPDFRDVP